MKKLLFVMISVLSVSAFAQLPKGGTNVGSDDITTFEKEYGLETDECFVSESTYTGSSLEADKSVMNKIKMAKDGDHFSKVTSNLQLLANKQLYISKGSSPTFHDFTHIELRKLDKDGNFVNKGPLASADGGTRAKYSAGLEYSEYENDDIRAFVWVRCN